MKRKLLSLLLCLAMVLTVVPLTAFAEVPVTAVFLSGSITPSVGDRVSDFPSLTSQQPDRYTVVDCYWYNDSEGSVMTDSSLFGTDTLYSLCCVVEGKPGYSMENVSAGFINGSSESVDNYYSEYDPDTGYYLLWTSPVTLGGAISWVSISGHKSPYVGDTAGAHLYDLTLTSSQYFLGAAQWFCENDDRYMDDSEVFEAGKEYALGLVLSPASGFYFTEDVLSGLDINGLGSYYVDYTYTKITDEGNLLLWLLPMEAFFPELIEDVFLTGFSPAVAGDFASAYCDITPSDDSPVEVVYPGWHCENTGTMLQETDSFEAGQSYSLGFYLIPLDGYVFSNSITVYINGTTEWVDYEYSGFDEYGDIEIWTTARTALSPISTVNVLNVPTAEAGKRAGDYTLRVSSGAPYQVSDVYWFCDTTGEAMEDDDVFVEGNEYSFCVWLSPDAGYGFSFSLSYLMGGSSAGIDRRYCSSTYDAAYLWSLPTVAGEGTSSGITGDVNGDGEVGSPDLTALARHVGGISQITDSARLSNANVNSDGELDSADLTLLARYVGGIIEEF